jgi:hypothetical protein
MKMLSFPDAAVVEEVVEEPKPVVQPEREGKEDTGPLIARAIIRAMAQKGYLIEEDPYKVNIVGVRNQYPGQNYSNKFIDKMFLLWKETPGGEWKYKSYLCSTMPGTLQYGKEEHAKEKGLPWKLVGKWMSMKKWCSYCRKEGLGILRPGQYIDNYFMGKHCGARAMKNHYNDPKKPLKGKQYAYRDKNWNSKTITYSDSTGPSRYAMYIHKAYSGTGSGTNVSNWSEGCQVFPSHKILTDFFDKCEIHKNKYGNNFHYTLMTSEDVNRARTEIEAASQNGGETA